ncbi:hypothetical protein [Tenacibaculum sp. SG-28]|uniref:hypothetical protein n=1 Tax=Tenacibaculum sp. SG-28 TaxID=754426 RepID=UPI000CF49B16|nr:hypothetical protein [Tenacibaculum sp. SG-28]PQJ21903.1 hypothetical protein BSU00_07685 [Tenacibaculum sp. SG-28]|tara:strand:- start:82 stop:384 length:303 start_codon:yes stop_codon:yes gene_type:complete
MPANSKYLTKSPWQKFAKLSAGIIGGYFIDALLHMNIALLIPKHHEVLVTTIVTFYIVWCALLIIPYLFKNGWKVWGLYGLSILLLLVSYYFNNQNNPFI